MCPKVKFITVVWGEAYIERFATLGLPSFLAPGNLPALAAVTDLEVVIMTAQRNIEDFDERQSFRQLRKVYSVRFVEIDDLISTNAVYGVTLTLAYARTVISCGADMLNTHFVFMNADFVLADGSLRGLAKHILAGRSMVIAPSFRAREEALEPPLLAAVNRTTGTLAMAPREMVGLALRHPHLTTIAKTVNQGFCHTVQPNQFFWWVDEHTILARYYLIFMLCIKPERMVTAINSYCDYGFIPEMCPSGDTVIMGDSDKFFMLELQHWDQEIHLLALGRQPIKDAARSLARWATAEHLRPAGYEIVFHTRDIPPEIEDVKVEAQAFIDRIGKVLRRPVPHAFHPYWVDGVEIWKKGRLSQGLSASPAELDIALPRSSGPLALLHWPRVKAWLVSLTETAQSTVVGTRPRKTPFHADWLDYRLLRRTLDSVAHSGGTRLLIVREKPELVDSLVGPDTPVQFATPREVLRGRLCLPRGKSGGYTHILIYLLRKDCRLTRRLVEQCRSVMDPGSHCHVFIHHLDREMGGSDLSFELVHNLEDIIGPLPSTATCLFVGGRLKRFNHELFHFLGSHYARFGLYALLWALPAMMIGLPLALLTNLYLRRKLPGDQLVQKCSSVLIRFGPADGAAHKQTSQATSGGNCRRFPCGEQLSKGV